MQHISKWGGWGGGGSHAEDVTNLARILGQLSLVSEKVRGGGHGPCGPLLALRPPACVGPDKKTYIECQII